MSERADSPKAGGWAGRLTAAGDRRRNGLIRKTGLAQWVRPALAPTVRVGMKAESDRLVFTGAAVPRVGPVMSRPPPV